jgi:nitrate/nitrite transporter NarK
MSSNPAPDERTPLLQQQHEQDSSVVTRIPSASHWLAPEVAEEGTVPVTENGSSPKDKNPFLGDFSKTQFWFLYGPILLVYFVAMFDSTLMASSHPVITSYFHSSNAASWLSTSFMLTSTAFQPLFGRVSDTIGRRPLYLFALVIFIATTAWCALAQSMGSFIAARAFCGLGAGGVISMVLFMTLQFNTC